MRALADVGRELELGASSGSAAARRAPAAATSPRSWPTPSRRCSARSTSTAGLERAARLVHRLFDPLIEQAATLGAGLDWKTSLQELTATVGWASPSTSSPRPARTTRRCSAPSCRSRATAYGEGTGRSKKEAEQQAAAAGLAQHAGRAAGPGAEPPADPPPDRDEADAQRARAARGRGRPPRPGPMGRRPHGRAPSRCTTPGRSAGTSPVAPTSPPGCAGRTVSGADRRGQVPLAAALGDADGDRRVLAHLGMSGQLLVRPPAAPDETHLRVRLGLDGDDGASCGSSTSARSAALGAGRDRRGGTAAAGRATSPATRWTRPSTTRASRPRCGAGVPASSARCWTRPW